jgi:valyl-tRNA synthetase
LSLPKRYNPRTSEPQIHIAWQEAGTYHFDPDQEGPRYVIDTPPPTVSGHLHLGHVFSYSHADFLARFWRMNGRSVLYPMGYDDNGLPTERLVERWLGIKAQEVGRQAFIEKCLQVSEEAEKDYQTLWQRLGLSIDWRYTYRTIDHDTRRLSQLSFIDLHNKGLVYRKKAPTIWCPECQTAIAQADLEDLERESEFVTLDFRLEDGSSLPIATTRPELLPACVAVFVHPGDPRYRHLVGGRVRVPLFEQDVPLMADEQADPEKGTGAVMCCTFGDTNDVSWWHTHELELVEAIGSDGRMTGSAGDFAHLPIDQARQKIKLDLDRNGLLLDRLPTSQSVRIHERCETPVEYLVTSQWFIRVLDFKEQFLAAGEQVDWYPKHMKTRYRQWVENLNWDWCITRQRYFGVTFPVWYCRDCGKVTIAREEDLPIDPTEVQPDQPCTCGSSSFIPETDVMDTWATSSLSPQLVARWVDQSGFDGQPFIPVSVRPQAHEIIRTWAFYSIVKAHHHFGQLPWQTAAISGWALAPEGTEKISKRKGGGPMSPMEMIESYSADAARYWAASTGLGKDAVINEEKIQAGAKLVTKLWNVARFSQRFIIDYRPPTEEPKLTMTDRWILSRLHKVIGRVTELFHNYDYATAKSDVEIFFWNDLADNYLEMVKKRLYDEKDPGHEAARFTLLLILIATTKLFAPFLPYVTERIYQGFLAALDGHESIHLSSWPSFEEDRFDPAAETFGEELVHIATAVRRYKSAANLSLGSELPNITLAARDPALIDSLLCSETDIMSITRALQVSVIELLDPDPDALLTAGIVDITFNN